MGCRLRKCLAMTVLVFVEQCAHNNCEGFAVECLESYAHHASKGGEHACCLPILCQKGQEARICHQNYTPASCVDCHQGTYQDRETYSPLMLPCIVKTICRRDQVVLSEGSRSEDRSCKCNAEAGYYGNPASTGAKCSWKKCPLKTELHHSGECAPCQFGYYNNSFLQSRCHSGSTDGSEFTHTVNKFPPASVPPISNFSTSTVTSSKATGNGQDGSNTDFPSTNFDTVQAAAVALSLIALLILVTGAVILVVLIKIRHFPRRGSCQQSTDSNDSSIPETKQLIAEKSHHEPREPSISEYEVSVAQEKDHNQNDSANVNIIIQVGNKNRVISAAGR